MRVACLVLLLAACDGRAIPPRGAASTDVASVELHAELDVIGVGQTTVIHAETRDASGALLDDAVLTWESSDPAILSVNEGTVTALASGAATIRARAGDVASEGVGLEAVDRPAKGPPSVRVSPGRLVLAPGAMHVMSAAARDAWGSRIDAEIMWESSDPAVARMDAGVLTAVGVGSAEIRARHGEHDSPPVEVVVTDADDYLAVGWQAPTGDFAARAQVQLVVSVQAVQVGAGSRIGVPVAADAVEVHIDGVAHATLEVGNGADHGLASGIVDVSGFAPGAHVLRVRASAGGRTGTSEPRFFEILGEPDDSFWTDVGGVVDGGGEAAIRSAGDELMVVASRCERECNVRAHLWTGEGWDALTFQRQLWREKDGGGFAPETRDTESLALPRFVGWGWPPTRARGVDVARGAGARYVTAAFEEARTSFNAESAPERHWFDCYVMRWDGGAGFDGQGGWTLLSSEDPEYLSHLPDPATLPDPDDWGDQVFPAGADRVRTADCHTPQIAIDGDVPLLAYVATPWPDTDWRLELRAWQGGAWADRGASLPVTLREPAVRELLLDAEGAPVAAVTGGDGAAVHRQRADGSWTEVEDGQRRLLALALGDSGSLFGAGVGGGDGAVHLGSGSRWAGLGGVLDVQPWAEVHDIALAVAGDTFLAAWIEGPAAGNRVVYLARYDAAIAAWQVLGDGPVEADIDRSVSALDLSIDAAGHAIVAYREDTGELDQPYRWRVRRTAAPVVQ